MPRHVLVALLLTGAATANAQTPADLKARTADLVLSGRVVDLVFAGRELRYTVIDTGGKTAALNVKETPTEIRIEVAADVLFDFDKAAILPRAQSTLHDVAGVIKEKGRGRDFRIEGYTDSKGSDAYNQKLSERRADAVKQWLAQKEGLSNARMTTQGLGAKRPVAANTEPDGSDNPDGRQKNRRVEIVLAK
ncbi:MAG TPA: OmpA family protein [Stellaceae bacterium]